MPCKRTTAALVAIIWFGVMPAGALGAGARIPRLSSTPPPRLQSAPTPVPTPAPAARPHLPRTGEDLRSEVLIALALVFGGGALRRRLT